MYMSLLIHLIWIQPSFPPRNIHSLRKKVHSVASMVFPMMVGTRYSTKWWISQHKTIWFVCFHVRTGFRAHWALAGPNHYLKFCLAMLPVVPMDFAGWIEFSFPEIPSYSATLFPSLRHSTELLLNSRSPVHHCSWSLVTLWHGTCPGGSAGGMLWKHCRRGIISIIGGRTQPVIFIFINPSGHLQLTRFFFWLRQPDSNKLLLAYVFHCDAEHLNSKWSE